MTFLGMTYSSVFRSFYLLIVFASCVIPAAVQTVAEDQKHYASRREQVMNNDKTMEVNENKKTEFYAPWHQVTNDTTGTSKVYK